MAAIAKPILSVLFARSAATADPLAARLATEFASVRHSRVNSPGLRHFFRCNAWLWSCVIAVLAVGFAGLLVTEPVTQFLIISTIITVALVGTAAAASSLWFGVVLRKTGCGSVRRRRLIVAPQRVRGQLTLPAAALLEACDRSVPPGRAQHEQREQNERERRGPRGPWPR